MVRDRRQVILRPTRPDDAPRLQALYRRLSPESIFFRFLGQPRELSDRQAWRLAMEVMSNRWPGGDPCRSGLPTESQVDGGLREIRVSLEEDEGSSA